MGIIIKINEKQFAWPINCEPLCFIKITINFSYCLDLAHWSNSPFPHFCDSPLTTRPTFFFKCTVGMKLYYISTVLVFPLAND